MANEYTEQYGITKTAVINVNNNDSLNISFNPIVGTAVISGVLIEKLY